MVGERTNTYHVAVPERDMPVAMVVGHTGAGKSSLVNHLFGREVAAVGDIASQTMGATAYSLADSLYLVDTRGLGEVGAAAEVEQQLTVALSRESPDRLLYVMDGSRRDGLDEQLRALDRVLGAVFDNVWAEPGVFLILNRMDLLAPAGVETLPPSWPEITSEKGRNIHQRIKQVYDLAQSHLKNELVGLYPTSLEWYPGARPWNLSGLREKVQEDVRTADREVARRFTCASGSPELALLMAVETDLIDGDIAADLKHSATDSARAKRGWQERWRREMRAVVPEEREAAIRPGGGWAREIVPADPAIRTAVLLELMLFEPYWPLEAEASQPKSRLKADPRLLRDHRTRVFTQLGVPDQEIAALNKTFRNNHKRLAGTNWKKVAAVAVGGAAVGVTGAFVAVPVIAGAVGSWLGLSGAVAVNAGLAWLGFGSLAAGGFGMFGGTVVIMGGGALLAGGGSAALMKSYAPELTRERALNDCARLLALFEHALLPDVEPDEVLAFARQFKKTAYAYEIERGAGADAETLAVFRRAAARIDELRKQRRPMVKFKREDVT